MENRHVHKRSQRRRKGRSVAVFDYQPNFTPRLDMGRKGQRKDVQKKQAQEFPKSKWKEVGSSRRASSPFFENRRISAPISSDESSERWLEAKSRSVWVQVIHKITFLTYIFLLLSFNKLQFLRTSPWPLILSSEIRL